jgi:hypothetical protein
MINTFKLGRSIALNTVLSSNKRKRVYHKQNTHNNGDSSNSQVCRSNLMDLIYKSGPLLTVFTCSHLRNG